MSLHTWLCQGPRKSSSCATFMFNSHWGRVATGQKVLHLCVQSPFGSVRLFATLQTVACQSSLSDRGFSPGKNTRVYWPILVAIPFQNTIFPAALAANSPEYLVLPEPLQPKKLHHLHTWPSLGQTQVLQGSLRSKSQWTTHMQRWE